MSHPKHRNQLRFCLQVIELISQLFQFFSIYNIQKYPLFLDRTVESNLDFNKSP